MPKLKINICKQNVMTHQSIYIISYCHRVFNQYYRGNDNIIPTFFVISMKHLENLVSKKKNKTMNISIKKEKRKCYS